MTTLFSCTPERITEDYDEQHDSYSNETLMRTPPPKENSDDN